MSDKVEGFRGQSVEEVQRELFLREMPRRNGRFRYRKTGLKSEAGTVVLFQFKAHVIASAVFVRDEKFDRAIGGSDGGSGESSNGVLHFEVKSFRTFDPLDAEAMRKVWPWFKKFGHAKQSLNPALYSAFCRQLEHVRSPKRRQSTNGHE